MEREIIIQRFFASLQHLIDEGVLRGLATFTTRYNIERRNMLKLRKNPSAHIGGFNPVWLVYLARDYMVSPSWLLLGEGKFFQDGWNGMKVRKMQIPRKQKTTPVQSLGF